MNTTDDNSNGSTKPEITPEAPELAAGVDGHRDAKTTLIYADYQPAEDESEKVSRAFR